MARKNELSDQELSFVEHYLILWVGAKAARAAGYSEHTARQQASRLLKKKAIRKLIDDRLDELKMKADEVLVRLSDHARGSMADFIALDSKGRVRFDFNEAQKNNKLHLIKKLTIDPTDKGVKYTLELYDAQAAQIAIGKHHQLWTDKIDMSSAGQPITMIFQGLPDDDGGSDANKLR